MTCSTCKGAGRLPEHSLHRPHLYPWEDWSQQRATVVCPDCLGSGEAPRRATLALTLGWPPIPLERTRNGSWRCLEEPGPETLEMMLSLASRVVPVQLDGRPHRLEGVAVLFSEAGERLATLVLREAE